MIALQPRHFVHRGSVLASGFVVRWSGIGLREARLRILHLWEPGLRVKKIEDGFIVLLPSPLRVMAEEAIGEPLLRHEHLLTTLPLESEEIGALNVAGDSIVMAQAGNLLTLSLAQLADEDIAQWIDTSSITVADATSLGPPPQGPAFVATPFDLRSNVPGVPAASSELQNLLAELRQSEKIGKAKSSTSVPASVFQFFKRMQGYMGRLLSGLSSGRRTSNSISTKQKSATVSKNKRLLVWLMRNSNRLLDLTGLWRLMSSRHGRYLARMMEMMESGDMEEGLRHAIPLADAVNLTPKPMNWFGIPRRRSSLSIKPYSAAPEYSWAFGGKLYAHLRDLYRLSFQRLAAQGRIEEAAFVLTELLGQHTEAVSFLEKHGRLRLAAEIAEGRMLSPVMAIRLWWLAGESHRALVLACRTGEFERAIQHLSAHPEHADKLRLAWAERLAASGKYLAAAEAVWPVHTNRYMAEVYLDHAIELGGTAGAMALARKSARYPSCFAEVLPAVETLMAEDSGQAASARQAFARALCGEARIPESQALARVATRSMVRDIQQGLVEVNALQLRKLLDYTGDAALRVDVARGTKLPPVRQELAAVYPLDISASDVGSRSIYDVAMLPDGRLLLALGEAGLLLLSRDGKTISQFNQPAQQFVVSDDSSRVLGIAKRDSVSRLVRFDALACKAAYWCDIAISAYTADFDGSVWCVANGEDVFLIDTLGQGFETVWRIPDLDGNIRAMQRNRKENRLYVVTENREHLTHWTFEHPSCVLRAKQQLEADLHSYAGLFPPAQTPSFIRVAIAISEDDGAIYEQVMLSIHGQSPQSMLRQRSVGASATRRTLCGEIVKGSLRHMAAHNWWVAIPVWKNGSVEVFLLDSRTEVSELVMKLHGAKEIILRFADDILLCADDQGRIVALNVLTRKIVIDLRV